MKAVIAVFAEIPKPTPPPKAAPVIAPFKPSIIYFFKFSSLKVLKSLFSL